MVKCLILLGDSSFDNGAYVLAGQRDVAAHLRGKLAPQEWTVELRAVDGSSSPNIKSQLERSPIQTPCCFVLSAGGNDALSNIEFLYDSDSYSFATVLERLYDIKEIFRSDYQQALDRILLLAQPLIVCTIYNPKFPEDNIRRAAEAALSVFNDVIVEEALRRSLQIINLREVCKEEAHFANPIEPSELGGERIADAIMAALKQAQS